MSLLERHRYVINKLADAFRRSEDEIERMIVEPNILKAINMFFSIDGPSKILITIELIPESERVPLSIRSEEDDEDDEKAELPPEPLTHRLKIHFEDLDQIPSLTVFFMKNRRPRDNAIKYSIDPSKANDGLLSFGILQAPLESLEVMMRCMYKPLIQNLTTDLWGHASQDHKSELLNSLDSFTKGLQESIRSISGGLELKKPDERLELLGIAAASDPVLVTHALNLLQEWCVKIEQYLDDSDRSRWETPDSGPDTELGYWRNRTQR
jgi:hypothetical protein